MLLCAGHCSRCWGYISKKKKKKATDVAHGEEEGQQIDNAPGRDSQRLDTAQVGEVDKGVLVELHEQMVEVEDA